MSETNETHTESTTATKRRTLDPIGLRIDTEQARRVRLTPRETEVLQLMCSGMSNTLIASVLVISVKTVEAHRARIFKRLAAGNVAAAVVRAVQEGVLRIDTHVVSAQAPAAEEVAA